MGSTTGTHAVCTPRGSAVLPGACIHVQKTPFLPLLASIPAGLYLLTDVYLKKVKW